MEIDIRFQRRLIGWAVIGALLAANWLFGRHISEAFQSNAYVVLIAGMGLYFIVFLVVDKVRGRDRIDSDRDLKALVNHLTKPREKK
jgi:hypothetical protein